jgi:F-type H+-transporting ATPase subunit c
VDQLTTIAVASIVVSGLTIAVATIGPALAQGRAVAEATRAIARQPDEASTITRTLFVGLAMIESFAIYCLVITMVLLFFNPFWRFVTDSGG